MNISCYGVLFSRLVRGGVMLCDVLCDTIRTYVCCIFPSTRFIIKTVHNIYTIEKATSVK